MQRALFARLLLQDARVIVLDEPFNAVDARTVSDLVALVQRWHGEQRTVMAPAELPIGVVTAMIGAPFFLLVLRRSRVSA
jgi:ABC-type thiamine transport system ATPase subunit